MDDDIDDDDDDVAAAADANSGKKNPRCVYKCVCEANQPNTKKDRCKCVGGCVK